MAAKIEKLQQNLANLEVYIQNKTQDNQKKLIYFQEFKELFKKIQAKQLTIQIVSATSTLMQSVSKILDNKPEILENCCNRINLLPAYLSNQELENIANLEIKQETENTPKIYRLKANQKYLLGRGSDCQIQFKENLNKSVSWHHALVSSQKVNNLIEWQLIDCNSTNGTFVNGKKIVENYQLKNGDRITLAYPHFKLGIAELIFNLEEFTLEKDALYQSIIDCDILFLGIDFKTFLTSQVQKFIISLDNRFFGKFYLIIDLAEENLSNFRNLEVWLQKNISNLELELVPLDLKAVIQTNTTINQNIQQQLNNFYKNLDNTIKRQGDNLLFERLTKKLSHILEPIDLLLRSQQESLNQIIEQKQQKIEQINQVNFKETFKKIATQVNEEKERFFKQTKQDINQAKGALLDSYSKQSLIYKLQNAIEQSQPIFSHHRPEKRIKLQAIVNSQSQDINQYLINFCISYLSKWIETEWDKVCHVYSEGGLNSLLKRCSTHIQTIAPAKNSLFEPPQSLNISRSLLNSFVQNDSEVAYKETSVFDYIMKQLRTNMMQIMMMFTLILPLIGIKVNKTTLFGYLSQTFVKYPWSFGIFICVISYLLINAYKQDNQAKIEEACQVLKKDANSYYQSFAKNLSDRAIQELIWALEEEEKRIVASLAKVEHFSTEQLLDTERKLMQLKNGLEQDKLQQKNLEKEIADFNNLKRV